MAAELYRKAFNAVDAAIEFEKQCEEDVVYERAISHYQTSITLFSKLAAVETLKKRHLLLEQISGFKSRVDFLQEAARLNLLYREITKINDASCLNKLIELADKYLELLNGTHKDDSDVDPVKSFIKTRVSEICDTIAQKRAAELKMMMAATEPRPPIPIPPTTTTVPVVRGGEKYSPHELDVLRRSSVINGKTFLPYISELDSNEVFTFENTFTDPEGLLSLSPKQATHFAAWRRPHQLGHVSGCKMIHEITPETITQDCVTDCSFVASLCITAAYEKRFKKQLITRIIYPQQKESLPQYNRSGKYLVKLWVNGVPRKVVVDDLLPTDSNGRLLCSYTTHPGELWVSIIEKAYMKLNGGYDFPGSNSGIDLYSLTGWIPETISLERTNIDDFDSIWNQMQSAYDYGDCLITIGTGNLSQHAATILGLVPNHAYAVLNVKEVSTKRLLKVKNPWRKKRWKGPYSYLDSENLTPELQHELSYYPSKNDDDGIFWIDFESVTQHFCGVFLNWNPELFKFRTTLHQHWSLLSGPRNDTYTVGYNPQYELVVSTAAADNSSTRTTTKSVWVLLSRHATCKARETDEAEYLTLHVYSRRNGKRVYYPEDALIRGSYSSNPHTLSCIDVDTVGSTGDKNDTDQHHRYYYEKKCPLDYTISVYSTTQFKLREASFGPDKRREIRSEWKLGSAGGCPSHPTFMRNPQYKFSVKRDGRASFFMEAPIKFAINLRLVGTTGCRVSDLSQTHEFGSSQDYRHGFCYFEIENLLKGDYTLIPSTYNPDSIGPFVIKVATTATSIVSEIPQEGQNMKLLEEKGKWKNSRGTAAGCPNFKRYIYNPRYLIHLPVTSDKT